VTEPDGGTTTVGTIHATAFLSSEVIMDFRKTIFHCKLLNPLALILFVSGLPLLIAIPPTLQAQTAGEGTISGTVTDSTGASIPNAQVTAIDTATNVPTVRTSSSSGLFTIAPLPPGEYSLQVTANGFESLRRDGLTVNALGVLNIDVVLTVGQETQTVVVTTAPPVLDTSTSTLGLVMQNETYANLPLQMNNSQRDPTAFGALTPGAQGGSRLPVIGGTGNYLGQLYLDGMPAETVSQQGDNRLVAQAVSLDAVDQFQVVTSTPPAEYSGAGAMNFTMKSGGLVYHGQVSDFVRNTIFDAWSFTAKAATTKNAEGETIPAPKPSEHQNELSASVGGPVPHTAHKLFFFFAYDRYSERKGATYSLYTVPTTLMRGGDFTELNGNVGAGGQQGTGPANPPILYNPASNNCVGSVCTRQPFAGLKNGVPTYNVIPSGSISPIAQAMQSFLPAPTNNSVILNNYLGGQPSGFNNFVINYRVDFDLSAKQRISTVGALGTVDYLNNYGAPFLPPPYVGGDLASIYPKVFDIQHTYTINNRLINQFKYGYTRFFQNIHNATQGVAAWEAPKLGISNLPPGQASEEFPGATFATTPAYSGVAATSGGPASVQTTWTGYSNAISTQLTTPNNFTVVDNLQWLKGRHALTFGITIQWQEINNANPATYTGVLDLPYNANSTANFAANSDSLSTGTATAPSGYSYASFLLGAVGGTPSIGLQPVSELGGRYRPVSPYVEDSFKVTSKLTLDLGLRWDYLPPYHEVKNRWTFLNPNLTNGATGTPGELQFAGNYGGAGVSCGCQTPVHTYWKNWGPRIGLAYSVNSKMVIRAGFGEVFSQAGGVGGRGGAYQGTGQTGFNVTATGPAEVTTGLTAAPSFYLNGGNTSLFGPGYVYPTPPSPGAASQILNTGNYVNSGGKFVTASGVSYADPYISGRAPEFNFYNGGIERAITKDMTLEVNYVGNQSHFLIDSTSSGGNARGYWANQLDPKYLAALGGVTDSTGSKPILISAATPANVAKAQAAMAGLSIPPFFQNAAAVKTTATIAQGLVAFPQYSGVTDTWGENVGNFSYNSFQITLLQRLSRGLTFNVNYTYSKNLGDDGTFRSGFPIPAGAISGGGQSWRQDRIERSWSTISTPQSFHAFGVYELPFGKGHLGNDSFLVRSLASGWQLSNIYTYSSGTPMAVIWTGCTSTNYPGQGQCMPDLNPAFAGYRDGNARIHGSYGTAPHGTTACNLGIGPGCVPIQYIDVNAFATPANVSGASTPQYLIGNAPRTRPLNLNNPGTQNLDSSLRRSFSLPRETSFVFEVDCLNTWNKVTFSPPNQSWSAGSTTFGTITGVANTPRDYQFAAHFKF
jgi:Carboxypeptidase regulatory-like domain